MSARVSDEHRGLLRAAAIADEVIDAHCSTVTSQAQLNGLGFHPVPGILFQWRTVSGRTFRQYRPDKPREGRKYVQAAGSGSAMLTPDTAAALDPSVPLLIVEGTKQHLAAASVDLGVPFAVAGMTGCRGWMQNKRANADLSAIPLEGRDVTVILDGDVSSNPNVLAASWSLKAYLADAGAGSVRFAVLPPGPDGKAGLDDVLGAAADPSGTLLGLLADAVDSIEAASEDVAKAAAKIHKGDYGDPVLRLAMAVRRKVELLRATGDGIVYALPHGSRVAEPLTEGVVHRVLASSALPASRQFVSAVGPVTKHLGESTIDTAEMHLRSAVRPEGLLIDLGIEGDSRCVLVTAAGWEVLPTPPKGVLFRRNAMTNELPVPERGGTWKGFPDLLLWAEDSDEWRLARGWLAAAFFPQMPRPSLVFVGPAGSAKTTRARMLTGLVDPAPAFDGAFGGSFRGAGDNTATALSCYIPKWDNLPERLDEDQSNWFARMHTGAVDTGRKFYTNHEMATAQYLRTSCITAVNAPQMGTDALDRVIEVELAPMPDTERRPVRLVEDECRAGAGRWFAALLDDVARVLAGLPGQRAKKMARPRMADYFDVVSAIDPVLGEAFVASRADTMRAAGEGDPFVLDLVHWLEQMPGRMFEGTGAEALESAKQHRVPGRDPNVWFPHDPTRFAKAINAAKGKLDALGFRRSRVNKMRRIDRYWLVGGGGAGDAGEGDGGASVMGVFERESGANDASDSTSKEVREIYTQDPPSARGAHTEESVPETSVIASLASCGGASTLEDPYCDDGASVIPSVSASVIAPAEGGLQGLGRWTTDPEALPPGGPVAVDVETTGTGPGLRVRTVQAAATGPDGPVCVLLDIESDPSLVEVADRLLAGRDCYSFTRFDERALAEDGRFAPVAILDAAPLVHHHDPAIGANRPGLKTLMARYGMKRHVTAVTAEQTVGMATTDPEFRRYAVTDALALLHLLGLWLAGRQDWLARENRIAEAAAGMRDRGARIDPDALGSLEAKYAEQRDDAEAALAGLGLANPRSPKQVVEAIQARGIEMPMVRRKRKDGSTYYSPSASSKHLRTDDALVSAVQRFRSKASAVAYVEALREAADDGDRLHPHWHTLGARSSRWSCTEPNLQNVAKHGEHLEVRGAFVPTEGRVFVQADLSQIEYRAAAALSGDPEMARAYAEGGDLHIHAARVLSGRDEPTKEDRSRAKGIGFGKLYGQQLRGSAKAAGVSEAEMAKRIAEYDAAFPRLAEWCRDVGAVAERDGLSPVSPYGRRFPVRGAEHSAVNYLCQSTARELFCDWLLAVDAEFPDALVLAVHDEVVLEVDPAEAEKIAARVADLAAEANADRPDPLRTIPIVAEAVVAGGTWMGAY